MNDVNFLPDSYVRQCHARNRRLRHFGMIAAVTVLMGGWLLIDAARLAGLEQYALVVESQASAIEAQARQAAALETQRAELAREVTVQRQLAAPVTFAQITATVGSLLPDAATITDFSLNGRRPLPDVIAKVSNRSGASQGSRMPPAPAGTRREVDQVAVSIHGLAPNDVEVANFVGLLSKHALFSDVKLLYSKPLQVGDLIGREFRIDMNVPLERRFESSDKQPAKSLAATHGQASALTSQEVASAH